MSDEHVEDQLKAAQAEVIDKTGLAFIEAGIDVKLDTQYITKFQQSVLIKIMTYQPCSHLGSPRPLFAIMAFHFLLCGPCKEKFFGEDVMDVLDQFGLILAVSSDCCDNCEEKSTTFTPILWTLPPLTILGDFCDDCVAQSDGRRHVPSSTILDVGRKLH